MTNLQAPPSNPYVGPRAFQRGEALYGRDREVMELLDLLIAERIVLLYSPSGAGKTSLIQAALIPALEAEGFEVLPVMRVSHEPPPDVEVPPTANRYVLSALLSLEETVAETQQTPLAELAGLDLATYLERWPTQKDEADSTVLIFDQFEEILTSDPTDRSAKAAFFAQMGAALYDRQRWALFALREDHVAGLDPFLSFIPTRLSTTFRLELLGESAARQSMQRPAHQAGMDFTDAAATKLINDLRTIQVQQPDGTLAKRLGPYVEPVQLQVVCRRLWEKKFSSAGGETNQIQEADIEAVGDVDSALTSYYAERVTAIASETGVSERAIRDWFGRQLITDHGIRGQVLQGLDQSQGLDNRAIRSLVDAHLVRSEERRGAIWFELAHDRLVQPVRANNAAWREAHLSTLQRQAVLWEDQGRPDGLLLHDEALDEAERWTATRQDELTATERDFLANCREARAIAVRERRQARRIRLLAVGATFTTLIAAAAFVVALIFFKRSEMQLQLSTSRELAAAAVNNLSTDPELSILLAMRGLEMAHTAQAQDALHQAVQTSRVQYTLSSHSAEVYDVSFSPDGTRVATASWDGTAKVWDVASGRELLTLDGHSERVYGVSFSPDGRHLATSSQDGTARVWDTDSGRQLLSLQGHSDKVSDIAFSPDGMRLATASWDGTAKVWGADSGQELFTLDGHSHHVWAVAFSPDGRRLVTASEDRKAIIWDTDSGRQLLTLSGHGDAINDVAFSPDGTRLATASWDGTARVWDAFSGQPLVTFRGHTNWVRGVAFSLDGTRLGTASWDRTARVWDVASGQELLTLTGHKGWVRGVTFSPDGDQLATASQDGNAKLWNVSSSHELLTLDGHSDWVYDVAFSPECISMPDGSGERCGARLASAGKDGVVNIWDTVSGRKLLTLSGHQGPVRDVAFSPDGTRLASASEDRTARVWELESNAQGDAVSGRELFTLSGHHVPVMGLAFSPDGARLATASSDKTVKVWDVGSARELFSLTGHTNRVNNVVFSSDGKLATSSGDRTAKVWDAASGEELLTLRGHTDEVYRVTFSPDGKHLATAGVDGTARVWDAGSGQELLSLTGHNDRIQDVAFSIDGTRLATASWDGTVKIWDVVSGREMLTLSGHSDQVLSVDFSPACVTLDGCGMHLATAGRDKTVRLYTLDIEELMDLARTRLTRTLTGEECARYLHQEECAPIP